MKRFVSYLYECERGNKSKNVGFIRVNVHEHEARMEVFIRNLLIGKDEGKLYALIHKNGLEGIKLTDIVIGNGQGDVQISFQIKDIMGSGCSLQDIMGIGIRLDSGVYIVSCWKDVHADAITRGDFVVEQKEDSDLQYASVQECVIQEESKESGEKQEPIIDTELPQASCYVNYEKIDLSQIRDLPSPNWHLTTNSFLVHGFWNYGYLVLKKEMEDGKETLALGVPGIFEKPEAVMAVLFGFPSFQAIPKTLKEVPMCQPSEFSVKEKNQEAEVGEFGCWFVELKM